MELDKTLQVLKILYEDPIFKLCLCEDLQRSYPCVCKVIELKNIHDLSITEGMRQQFEYLGRISHFNIYHHYRIIDSHAYLGLAYELPPGKSLQELLNSGKLFDFKETAEIIVQVASALDAVHVHDIYHGTLSLNDIYIGDKLKVHIIGFGFCDAVKELLPVKQPYAPLLCYLSPEAVLQRGTGKHSDIFTLGSLLFELLTGVEAFAANSNPEVLERILEDNPPPPRAIDTRIPAAFNNIIARALSKHPKDRYSTCSDFIAALKSKQLKKEVEILKVLETEVEKDEESLEALAEELDFKDEQRTKELSDALKEWKSSDDIKLMQQQSHRPKDRRSFTIMRSTELADEIEDIFERKDEQTVVKESWITRAIKPTASKGIGLMFLVGLFILYMAYHYKDHRFWFSGDSTKQMVESARDKARIQQNLLRAKLLEKADEYIAKGAYVSPPGQNAFHFLKELKTRYPDDVEVKDRIDALAVKLYNLGQEAITKQRFEDALRYFEDYLMIRSDPKIDERLKSIRQILQRTKTARKNQAQVARAERRKQMTVRGLLALTIEDKGNYKIEIFDPQTRRTTIFGNEMHSNFTPSFSKDKEKIAFVSDRTGNREIFLSNYDGSNLTQLTDNIYEDGYPIFSISGASIFFISKRYVETEIYMIELSSKREIAITNNRYRDDYPTMSPDGRYIAFESYRDLNWDIYCMDINSRAERRLTNDKAEDRYPAWSPQGDRIAFVSNRDFNSEIYLVSPQGSNLRRMTNSMDRDYAPCWSPDGRFIAYVSEKGKYTKLMIITSDGRFVTHYSMGYKKILHIAWR